MDTPILSSEEQEIYQQVKEQSKAKTEDDLFRWLLHDWKRLMVMKSPKVLTGKSGHSSKSLYSSRGISLGGGLTEVSDEDTGGNTDLDDLGKIDLGGMGGTGGMGGIGGIG